jgi:predicted GIY-YIG superfamily endonuclease
MTRTASVYRAYDADDRLLYVGQSTNPTKRIATHKACKSWAPLAVRWDVTEPMPVGDALDVEARAILRERPVYNVAGTSVGAAWEAWRAKAPRRGIAVLFAIGRELEPEILSRMFGGTIRPFPERLADAIAAVRAADESITDAEIEWVLDNYNGPFGGVR